MKFNFFTLLLFQLNIIIIEPIFSKNSNIYFGSSTNEKTTENILNKELIKTLFSYGSYIVKFLNLKDSKEIKDEHNPEEKIYSILRGELKNILNNSKISDDCRTLFDEYLIGNNESKAISNHHIKKLLDDSSKHKDDLGSFDQCLNKLYKVNISEIKVAKSSYVILLLDKSKVKNEIRELRYKKNRTDFDNVYYVRAFCLPQLPKNDSKQELKCSDNDYLLFINTINNYLNDLLGIRNVTKINVFSLDNVEIKKTSKEYFKIFLQFIPLIIYIIHAIIILLREIIMRIFKKWYSNSNNYIIKDIKEDIKSINKN